MSASRLYCPQTAQRSSHTPASTSWRILREASRSVSSFAGRRNSGGSAGGAAPSGAVSAPVRSPSSLTAHRRTSSGRRGADSATERLQGFGAAFGRGLKTRPPRGPTGAAASCSLRVFRSVTFAVRILPDLLSPPACTSAGGAGVEAAGAGAGAGAAGRTGRGRGAGRTRRG